MDVHLKPLHEQVVVITGASSGIGLTTARMAAERGAAVVLAARNEQDLARAVERIREAGGRAVHVVADVASEDDVRGIARAAVAAFGRIDTWVNNAGVAIYGKLMEVDVEDMRRQFDVLYWGEVYGSRVAVEHLRDRGGALINVASGLAERAVPLQGNYCAAKHAVKAFTDTLRMELEADAVPISVTLVKPASIDTPLFDKAKSYSGARPIPIPPVYAPEVVARAILAAAEKPIRDVTAGGAAAGLPLVDAVAPGAADAYMERTLIDGQLADEPVRGRRSNLYEPVFHDGGERGRWDGPVHERSLYTRAVTHPGWTWAAVGAAVGLGALLAHGSQRAARAARDRFGGADAGREDEEWALADRAPAPPPGRPAERADTGPLPGPDAVRVAPSTPMPHA